MSEVADDSPGAVNPLLRASFAVLRRPQNELEREREYAPEFVPPLIERFGLMLSEARMIGITDSARVWMTPGDSAVAFSSQLRPGHGVGSWFTPIEKAVSHGLWKLTESVDGVRRLLALLPDGNGTVTLDHADGVSTTMPTVGNALVWKEPALTDIGGLSW